MVSLCVANGCSDNNGWGEPKSGKQLQEGKIVKFAFSFSDNFHISVQSIGISPNNAARTTPYIQLVGIVRTRTSAELYCRGANAAIYAHIFSQAVAACIRGVQGSHVWSRSSYSRITDSEEHGGGGSGVETDLLFVGIPARALLTIINRTSLC